MTIWKNITSCCADGSMYTVSHMNGRFLSDTFSTLPSCYDIMLFLLFAIDNLLPFYRLHCTIFISKVMRHDTEDLVWSKYPTVGWPGPLVWPNALCTILTLSCAWPSPLWAYNFLVCFISFCSLTHLVPSCSIRARDSFLFPSILFVSILCLSMCFCFFLVIFKVMLYINHCTIDRKP